MSTDAPGRPSPEDHRGVDWVDVAAGGAAIVVGGAVIPYARSMPTIGEGLPGPGLFPAIIGVLLVLFGAVLVAKALVASRRGRATADGSRAATAPTRAVAVEDGATVRPATGAEAPAASPDRSAEADEAVVHPAMAETAWGRWVNGAVVLGAIVLYIVAAEALGFILTMFLILTGIMLTLRARPLPALITAAGVTALLYVVFEKGLLVQLPDGLLPW